MQIIVVRFFFMLVSTFCFPTIASIAVAQSRSVSNQLPISLVRTLREEGERDPDTLPRPEAEDLLEFWRVITEQKLQTDLVVDRIFGTAADAENLVRRFPSLYSTKFQILRFLLQQSGGTSPWLNRVHEAWLQRYTSMALATIELAQVREYIQIHREFRERIAKKEIRLVDLSPQERQRWAALYAAAPHKNHNEDILARGPDGKFLVQGRYQEESGYFAVDFARPLADTLITFAHEEVHAAHPQIREHTNNYVQYYDRALTAVRALLGPQSDGQIAPDYLLRLVLNENGTLPFVETAERIRQMRVSQLRSRTQAPGRPQTQGPANINDLKTWLRAIVGLTVENEYQAYGLSLLVYANLRTRLGILPPSENRQRFVDQFLRGDLSVAENLALRLSPFSAGSALNQFILQARRAPEAQQRLRYATETIELYYLEAVEQFMREVNNRFSAELSQLARMPAARAPENAPRPGYQGISLLPIWARPGGLQSPANPYQVISARITTSWVLRFRQTIDVVLADLARLNSPLLSLRAGILDLAELSVGERIALGVNYEGSPFAVDCGGGNVARLSNGEIPAQLRQLFQMVQWQPDLRLNGDYIDGFHVAQNIVRLRTLTSSLWLDAAFPATQSTFIGIRVFLQKLRAREYDRSDLSDERAQALIQELVNTIGAASSVQAEKAILRELLEQLYVAYRVAEQAEWREVMENFRRKSEYVRVALEVLSGVESRNERQPAQHIEALVQQFHRSLEPLRRECSRSAMMRFVASDQPYSLGGRPFPLSVICANNNLYLVRQPNDFTRQMTTQMRQVEGTYAPHSQICVGSRPVRLFPYTSSR